MFSNQKKASDGKIEVVKDEETKSHVIEIVGQNCSTNFIEGPNVHKDGFGLKLPYLHVLVKNLSWLTIKKREEDLNLVIGLKTREQKMQDGWNHFVFDMKKITTKSYGTNLQEITKMVVNANCRVRRIYFAEKMYAIKDIPNDFKVFIQGQNNGKYQEEVEEEEEEQNDDNN